MLIKSPFIPVSLLSGAIAAPVTLEDASAITSADGAVANVVATAGPAQYYMSIPNDLKAYDAASMTCTNIGAKVNQPCNSVIFDQLAVISGFECAFVGVQG